MKQRKTVKGLAGSLLKKNKSRKNRRESLGGLAEDATYNLLACPTGGTQTDDNENLSYNILKIFKAKNLASLDHSDMEKEFDMTLTVDEEIWDCVGVYLKVNLGGRINHAIPYLKIGTAWFDANNEVGYLRRSREVPSINMNILYINNSVLEGTIILQAILYYKKRSFLTERDPKDWLGVPTFGQHGLTCGPDSIQSILMYADGFYETFNRDIYQKKIKPVIDERFSYRSLLQEPYTRGELEAEKTKVLQLLDIGSGAIDIVENGSLIDTISKEDVQKAAGFFVYMLIRFYSIDSAVKKRAVGGIRKKSRSKTYD